MIYDQDLEDRIDEGFVGRRRRDGGWGKEKMMA